MVFNYNKLNFYGAIFGLIAGIALLIGLPFIILGKVPTYFILILILCILAFAILFMAGVMILLLLSKDMMRKLIAPVLMPAIIAVAFFALLIYQMLGPQLVDRAKLPYFNLIEQLNPWSIFRYLPYIAAGIFFIFLIPFLVYFLKFLYETAFTRERILKNGISSQARIVSLKDYGVWLNSEPVFKITLEINSPTQGTYQITKNFFTPHFTLSKISVGDMINVKIDPNNPKSVVLDTWTGEIKYE